MKLPTIYFVVAEYNTLGLALDQGFQDESDMIDQCCRHHEDDEQYRVFKIEFDVSSNVFETASEITEDVQDTVKELF